MLEALKVISTQIPLELFAMFGSFLEEVFAPIPSPFIMSTAAIVASQQNYTMLGMILIAIFGAVGKTVACVLVYYIADKSEDIVTHRFGKVLGVTHQQIEKIGSYLSKGWWDDILLFVLRAFPLSPSVLISVASGVLRINLRTFITATFFGTIVRNLFFMMAGLYGLEYFQVLRAFTDQNMFALLGLSLLMLACLLLAIRYKNKVVDWFIHHRKK